MVRRSGSGAERHHHQQGGAKRRVVGCSATVAGKPEFSQRRLIPLLGHSERKIRSPASLKEGVRRLLGEGSALRGPGQWEHGLDAAQVSAYTQLGATLQVRTDSHKARPKAEPRHVPLHKEVQKGERALKLPPSMKIVQRTGRSRRKGS